MYGEQCGREAGKEMLWGSGVITENVTGPETKTGGGMESKVVRREKVRVVYGGAGAGADSAEAQTICLSRVS